jgi:uncharacterized protein
VTNITAFGAFVDIGVHQDGLVHISQLADRFVNDANEVVKVQQQVQVTVLEIDLPRQRIALSMRKGASVNPASIRREPGDARTGPSHSAASAASTAKPTGTAATAKPASARPKSQSQPAPATGGWFTAALREAGKAK